MSRGRPGGRRGSLTRDRRVDLNRCEPGARVRVARPARLLQVRRVHGRSRVAAREDVVDPVAGCAIGDVQRPLRACQAVVGLPEGRDPIDVESVSPREHERLVTARAGRLGDVRREDGRKRIGRPLDVVLAMAIGADGRVADSACRGHPVDALAVDFGDLGVAHGAGRRDVDPVDRARWIVRREHRVRGVAGAAGRGVGIPVDEERASVDALHVGVDRRLRGDGVLRDQLGIGVAAGAGADDLLRMDARCRVRCGKDRVRSVAVRAGRRVQIPPGRGLSVDARQVLSLHVAVAGRAVHLGKRLGVGDLGDRRVAVRARKPAVDRAAELGRADVELDDRAIGEDHWRVRDPSGTRGIPRS